MSTFLLSFLMLFTIGVSLVFGISLGYWVICGILHFFNPARQQLRSQSRTQTLAATPSGD